MNLFKTPFREESFDVVISNGVLHHTGDARGGFDALLHKLKPGGHIIVGFITATPASRRRGAAACSSGSARSCTSSTAG